MTTIHFNILLLMTINFHLFLIWFELILKGLYQFQTMSLLYIKEQITLTSLEFLLS